MAAVDEKGIPPFVTPWWHGTLARGATCFFLAFSGFFLIASFGVSRPSTIPLVAMVVTQIIGWWCYDRHIKALRERLPEHEFMLCLRCGYDLRNLPDSHLCPECGEPFSRAELWDVWTKWLLSGFQFRVAAMTNGELYRKIMAGRSTCMLCSAPLNPPGQGLCASCIKKERIPVPKGA